MSCPDCFSGHVHPGTPRGKEVKLHGLDVYVAEPKKTGDVKGTIVVITDAFGWKFVNNRILADNYADKSSYRVYVPDFMLGHSAPVWALDSMRNIFNPNGLVKKATGIGGAIYAMAPFMYYNRPGRSYPVVKNFFVGLRQAEGAKLPVGAAGFCWGGKHVALLAADAEKVGGRPLIDAGFAAHPSFLSLPTDIENMKRPVAFALADSDGQTPVEAAEKIKAIVEAKPAGQTGEAVIYKNCGHGFAIRADTLLVDVTKQAEAAEDQALKWFDKHFGLGAQ